MEIIKVTTGTGSSKKNKSLIREISSFARSLASHSVFCFAFLLLGVAEK